MDGNTFPNITCFKCHNKGHYSHKFPHKEYMELVNSTEARTEPDQPANMPGMQAGTQMLKSVDKYGTGWNFNQTLFNCLISRQTLRNIRTKRGRGIGQNCSIDAEARNASGCRTKQLCAITRTPPWPAKGPLKCSGLSGVLIAGTRESGKRIRRADRNSGRR